MADQINLAHEPPMSLGLLILEPAPPRLIARDGKSEPLEPLVMRVLMTLVRANGAVLSRDDLRASCWQSRATSEDAVDRVIARIRRISEGIGAGHFTIETIPKIGYRILVDKRASPEKIDWRTSRRALVGGGIAVAAVAGLAAWRLIDRAPAETQSPFTLAVLPLSVGQSDPDLVVFARQASNALRSDLSRITDIRVIAETSSQAAVDERLSAREIGHALRADLLIEGRVERLTDGIDFAIWITDPEQESQLWAHRQRSRWNHRSQLEASVSGALMQRVVGMIPTDGNIVTAGRVRPDPRAYALVAEANTLLEEIHTDAMRGRIDDALAKGDQADALAQRALAIDTGYAEALLVQAALARNGWTHMLARRPMTAQQRINQSVGIIRRALIADPNSPKALTLLADYYRRFELRWGEAENLFRRVLAIDPSLVEAHWSYGYQLGTTGDALDGLDHALSVFELDPRNPFRRVALPRLLYVAGYRRWAMQRYRAEIVEQPDNIFLLRELYLMFLSEGNVQALKGLRTALNGNRSQTSRPPQIDELYRRVDAGIEALDGRPSALRTMVDGDLADYDGPEAQAEATLQGRARDDLLYIFAIEYAWSGATDNAIAMLDRALAAKSLYWPATLPYGRAPFPSAVRHHPRYPGLWQRDPALRELLRRRRQAFEEGRMAGFASDGQWRAAPLSATTARRVRAALDRTA